MTIALIDCHYGSQIAHIFVNTCSYNIWYLWWSDEEKVDSNSFALTLAKSPVSNINAVEMISSQWLCTDALTILWEGFSTGLCVNSAKVYTFVCVWSSITSPVGDCLTPPAQEVTGEDARCLCGNVVNRNLHQAPSEKIWTGFKKIPYSTLVFLDWYLNVDILL